MRQKLNMSLSFPGWRVRDSSNRTKNISADDVPAPLIVWNGMIADEHNRYKIAQIYH